MSNIQMTKLTKETIQFIEDLHEARINTLSPLERFGLWARKCWERRKLNKITREIQSGIQEMKGSVLTLKQESQKLSEVLKQYANQA